MPTVMLTTHCPNACEWCFARPKMEEYRARGIYELNWDDFLTVVDFYERSGLREMVLLGGEPGLHSRFMDILRYLHERAFSVLVVTTGVLPAGLVDRIADEKISRLDFGLNSTSYFAYEQEKRERIDYFLSLIGPRVHLAYTITEKDAVEKRVEPILDRIAMIMKFGLARQLQFQIAVPGEKNSMFVPFERYGDVAELLISWFRILRQNGISCGLDCHCIPSCEVPPHLREANFFRSRCDCFMIDIGPDLDIWPCFPLSGYRGNLARFNDLDEIHVHFSEMNPSRGIVYDERCDGCPERASGDCHGGCRGFEHVRKNPSWEAGRGPDVRRRPGARSPSRSPAGSEAPSEETRKIRLGA